MGYNGQGEFSQERVFCDGRTIFTEQHRRHAHALLATDIIDLNFIDELQSMATQKPFPSHQAQYFLGKLIDAGLALPIPMPNYDEVMAKAWKFDSEGYPNLVQQVFAVYGLPYEFKAPDYDFLPEAS